MALTEPAELKELCPATTGITGELGALNNLGTGWGIVQTTIGTNLLYWEGQIDLGAFLLKDLTWVTTGRAIQEPGNFEFNFQIPQRVEFIEFIANQPLNRTRLEEVASNWEEQYAVPGMMGSQFNFENIIMGRWRQFSTDTALATGSAVTLKTEEFGSGEPSASERLYCYCMLKFSQTPDPEETFFVPGRRFVLAGAAIEEKEYEYIMRLRRSYVQQESV